jgi:hypothetical protein
MVNIMRHSTGTSPSSHFRARYNPLSGSAAVSFSMPEAGRVSVNVFNQQGRHITTLANRVMPSGVNTVVWNARQVPAGVYFCRMAVNGRNHDAGKIVLGK